MKQIAENGRTVISSLFNDFEIHARRIANLSNRLYRKVIASKMRPFSDGVQMFPRMMRDLANRLKKQIKFKILGSTAQVDRDILEKMEAPLNHLSAQRGRPRHRILQPIGSPAGKSAEGNVTLEARHRAGMLCVTVSDDGRGINLETLKKANRPKENWPMKI